MFDEILIAVCAYLAGVFTAAVAKPVLVKAWGKVRAWLDSRKPQ